MVAINPFLLFTLGVAASMLVIPLVWRLAPQFGLIDQPDARKVHKAPVPRVGGWGITLGSIVPLLLTFPLDPLLQSFVLGMVTLFVFGVWDDAKELGHWAKFGGQFLAVGLVVFYGGLYVERVPFLDSVTLGPTVGKLFTAFALVGAINAINHSDGLDGLAGGESLLSLIAMAVLAHVVGDTLAVGIALASIGGILGFLRYNSHPARVFMGDSGSQVLGFTLGFLAVYLTQVAHTAVSAALPALLLGLPIADILAVLYLRASAGGSWFKATRNHVHHRLLDLGLDHYQTVIVIYSIQAVLVVSAVLLRYESDVGIMAVYLAVVGTLFALLHIAERSGAKLGSGSRRSATTLTVRRLAASPVFARAPLFIVGSAVPGFMLLAALWVPAVPSDFSSAAAILAVAVAVDLIRTRGVGSIVSRAVIYVTAIFAAYLLALYPGSLAQPAQTAMIVTMGVLAVAIALHVRTTTIRDFRTTPTDYLLLIGVLAMIAFGSVGTGSRGAVELVAYATVLLYGCEVVWRRTAARWPILEVAALTALTALAIRGAL